MQCMVLGKGLTMLADHGWWLQILAKGTVYNDASVSPIVRQSLLHWAYELIEPHFQQMAKKIA